MTDGKDTAVKTKPFISKENAQNRPETIQRETVLGVSAFREQISNSAAKRRCPLCPVCRNTSRENGRSFLMSVAGRNTTSFLYSMLPEGIEKTMHPLKSRTAPPSKSKLHPLDGFLSKLRFFAILTKRYRCVWRKARRINRFRAFSGPDSFFQTIDANRCFRASALI